MTETNKTDKKSSNVKGMQRLLIGLWTSCVVTAAVAADSPHEVAEFGGTVVPAREAEVTPIVSGWLQDILFVPGQLVEKGDVLFEFAKPPANFRQDLAQGQLSAAQAALREAIADVKRAETLFERDVISEAELDKARASRDVAAANVAQAEANLGLAGLGVMQMTQKAPISGVMSAPMVRENGWQDVTDDNITMAIITQLDPIQVVGEVPFDVYSARQKIFDSDAALIEGVEISLTLPDGSLYAHKGKLVSGGYTFDVNSQSIKVWVEFPNPDRFLRPGLKVTLTSRVKDE